MKAAFLNRHRFAVQLIALLMTIGTLLFCGIYLFFHIPDLLFPDFHMTKGDCEPIEIFTVNEGSELDAWSVWTDEDFQNTVGLEMMPLISFELARNHQQISAGGYVATGYYSYGYILHDVVKLEEESPWCVLKRLATWLALYIVFLPCWLPFLYDVYHYGRPLFFGQRRPKKPKVLPRADV